MMKLILGCLLLFTACTSALAQENQRPKVGLVLSGGGAKGLAHIGVLKVLEEQGVKIDYIGGTSMGAIIGGLYAAGYNAAQLDSIFQSVDANALLQDYIPRNSKSFYEKRNDEIYAVQLPFNNFKIGSPVSLSRGMYNYNLLNKLLAHVRFENDFSKLTIPFFCVATDVVTGDEVIIEKGSLPQSILASGAFPSLYTPVEINGKLLIDGGVVNNYPIHELREKGIDIIIGVDVQDGKKERENIKGMFDVLLQIANYGMYHGMDEKIKATDIYIKPDIGNYSVLTFDKGNEIIIKGVEAAKEKLPQLQQLSSNYIKPKLAEDIIHNELLIKEVKFNHLKYYNKDYIFGKLGYFEKECVPFDRLKEGITNLNATQNFSSINYHFEKGDQDGDYLVLSLKEATIDRYLKFGLHFDHLYKSGALVNVSQKKLLFKNDVASLDFVLGDNIRYNFNYLIDNGLRWSYGAQSKLTKFKHNIRAATHKIVPIIDYSPNVYNVDFIDFSNRIFIQNYYKNRFLIGLGIEHKYQRFDANNAPMTKAWIDNSHYLAPYFTILLDTYDNKYFPTKGVRFSSEIKHFALSSDYNQNFEPFSVANAEVGFTKTLFNRLSFSFNGEIGFTIGSEPSSNHKFFHGGYGFETLNNIKPFYGYNVMSLNADSYLKTLFTIDYRFYRRHHFNLSANFAQMGDSMFETANWIDLPRYSGYAIGYGLQTVIGPIEIKQSYSPQVKKHFTWFAVGFWF